MNSTRFRLFKFKVLPGYRPSDGPCRQCVAGFEGWAGIPSDSGTRPPIRFLPGRLLRTRCVMERPRTVVAVGEGLPFRGEAGAVTAIAGRWHSISWMSGVTSQACEEVLRRLPRQVTASRSSYGLVASGSVGW
jgi:hypothetical protein